MWWPSVAELVFENVCFRYPGADTDTIQDLSFVIDSGQAHALLGASGAGKTTLLNLMSGLLTPQSGRILLDGEDVTGLDGFARGVSQVFQFPVLYSSLSAFENLRVPLQAIGMDVERIRSRIEWVASELDLGDVLGRKPENLSLYQKQLLAVGKAIAREDTALVLLDEPLTAVEPQIKWSLRQTLRQVQADTGVTMVYVTHDQTEALTFASHVSVMTAEGLVQTGSPEEIYEQPANEYVAQFVGSPGMNLLATTTPEQTIGFRPEWVSLAAEPSGLVAEVESVRPDATHQGQDWGYVWLKLTDGKRLQLKSDNTSFVINAPLTMQPGEQVNLVVNKWLTFRAGQREAAHGF